MDHISQFRDALAGRRIVVRDIVADGSFQRADVDEPGGKGDASYILHLDGIPAGSICNWRDGLGWQSWKGDVGRQLTDAERIELRKRAEEQGKGREAAEAKRRADYKVRSAALWAECREAPANHKYAADKGVTLRKIRIYSGSLVLAEMPCNGALVVPLLDEKHEVSALQFINAEGEKRYFGPTAGRYFPIAKPTDPYGTLLVCEGAATGLSLFAATSHPVAVALDAGNLAKVGAMLRERYGPALRMIYCADDDHRSEGNPGVTRATEAARQTSALVAVPDFGPDRPDDAKDFNDLARLRGAEAVTAAVERAAAPQASTPQPATANRSDAVLVAGAEEVRGDSDDWPDALDGAAIQGLAGEIVEAIGPDTEADPAAILLQVLVSFGALVGRGPHIRVEGDQHHTNLFAVLVGNTSKARKGTSWGRVRELFGAIPSWARRVEGLSSGEGLKYAVRDPVKKIEKDRATGFANEVIVDAGVEDKRLLVVESEFAQVLRQASRAGNTLSATIRSAWDSGNLQTLTKNDPVTATGAHISIIGHITAAELRAELTATDSANGFANRFLFMAVRRSKLLPFGGEEMDAGMRARFVARLGRAADRARERGGIAFTQEARTIWQRVYPTLSEGHTGLLGAVTARGEAQVLRLALMYALMDESESIDIQHLMAALALWDRCEASARFVFGSALGDRVADEILRALRTSGKAGVPRTGISNLFKRNESAERIGAALELLQSRGLAIRERAERAEGATGRPTEIWRAA